MVEKHLHKMMLISVVLTGSLGAAEPSGGAGDILPLICFAIVLLFLTLGFGALCVIVNVLQPRLTQQISIIANRSFGRSLVYGMLITVIALLALILPSVTPEPLRGLLSLIILVPYTGLLVCGAVGITHCIGEKILTGALSPCQSSDTWAVAAGAFSLGLATLVPIIGWLVFAGAILAGAGALVRHAFVKSGEEEA